MVAEGDEEKAMIVTPKQRQIAYRCPECGNAVFGLVGRFAMKANLLRLKCSCEKSSSLDISYTGDGKIRLSVPCLFCRQNHSFVVSESIFFNRDKFLLNCPYTGMDISFIGNEDAISEELERTREELEKLLTQLEVDELADIQPQDMNEDEILPDPTVYDTVRFVVKNLEDEGAVDCPCHKGPYDLRFCDEGIQAYCETCGASYTFAATSPSVVEEYLSLDKITLK